ncbi:hypothetical protein BDZ97DRAFT_1667013 [Flammula alnicola]|nr:hypothetical protein BDZ97DRAFT_1667013 [Flammula alnicola]
MYGISTPASTRRANTTANAPPSKKATSLGRSGSRRSAHTMGEGRVMPTSAFVGGAGTTGPMAFAEQDEMMASRGEEAQASLTPKQRSRVDKVEAQNGKRLSKIIRQEGKTEKQALAIAINELDDLQKFQKNAIKSEARLQANHSKQVITFKKSEAAFLSAKMRYDMAQAQLNAEVEALETLRNNAREATERMQDKAAEVDVLRQTLAMDEREREVKLAQLRGPRKGLFN